MENLLLYIIMFCFIIGAIDYFEGNRFGVGKVFEKGIKTMGPLAISMVGILSITPLLSKIFQNLLVPVAEYLGLEPSIFSSSFIAVDMGAYNIALDLTADAKFSVFSGILMASIIGCTLSFTLPLALGLVEEKYMEPLTKGLLCGIVTIPIGLLFGGLLLKIEIFQLVVNLLPIILLAILLSVGIIYRPNICVAIFKYFGRIIVFISTIGLIVQGIYSIVGIKIVEDIMPLKDAIYIVGKVAIFLGGAYVMLEIIKKLLNKQINFIGSKMGVNANSIGAFIGSLASAIIVFSDFEKLDNRGRVICSAFSVSGAYVLGGQLGYVASVEPNYIGVYIITKILSGVLAVIFAVYIIKREEKAKDKFRNIITKEEAV